MTQKQVASSCYEVQMLYKLKYHNNIITPPTQPTKVTLTHHFGSEEIHPPILSEETFNDLMQLGVLF